MHDNRLYLCLSNFSFTKSNTEIIPFTNYYVSWVFRLANKLEKSQLLNSTNGEGLLQETNQEK